MNGRGIQILIEAVLVLASEVATWIQVRRETTAKKEPEDVSKS